MAVLCGLFVDIAGASQVVAPPATSDNVYYVVYVATSNLVRLLMYYVIHQIPSGPQTKKPVTMINSVFRLNSFAPKLKVRPCLSPLRS